MEMSWNYNDDGKSWMYVCMLCNKMHTYILITHICTPKKNSFNFLHINNYLVIEFEEHLCWRSPSNYNFEKRFTVTTPTATTTPTRILHKFFLVLFSHCGLFSNQRWKHIIYFSFSLRLFTRFDFSRFFFWNEFL